MDRKKIIIIGCSGSGKSTFARRLHDVTGLPIYHLDNLFWKADRTHISRDEFDARLNEYMQGNRWIIDGDYSRTYEMRIAACDTVIFLDYGEEVCMQGITERVGKVREDMPWIEDELDPELVEMVQQYETQNKPRLQELFRKYPEKEVITFYNRDDAMKWLISEYMIVPVDEDNIIEAACIHSISWQESHRAFCDEAFILKHDTDHQAEYIRNKIANGSKFYMLCDKQSMAVVSITDGLIEDLYVLPELQRQGYGTALLDYVITLICRKGITPTLWILENNREAERLYRRKGFVPSGKQNAITGKLSEIEFLYKGI